MVCLAVGMTYFYWKLGDYLLYLDRIQNWPAPAKWKYGGSGSKPREKIEPGSVSQIDPDPDPTTKKPVSDSELIRLQEKKNLDPDPT